MPLARNPSAVRIADRRARGPIPKGLHFAEAGGGAAAASERGVDHLLGGGAVLALPRCARTPPNSARSASASQPLSLADATTASAANAAAAPAIGRSAVTAMRCRRAAPPPAPGKALL